MTEASEMLVANCGDCVFTGYGIIEVGNMPCMRRSPTLDGLMAVGVWPLVDAMSWCGDFKPRSGEPWRFPTEPPVGGE